MDKVSFQDAAKQAEVHFNTLRNWRKAGKLKTAEKVLEKGRELWIVDPAEVVEIARQSRQSLPESPDNYHVDIDGDNPANDRSDAPPTPPNWPPTGPAAPGLTATPALEQTLVFMRESVVRPLVEANERQAARLEEMAGEIGTLKERLRALEAAQAARVAQPAPQPAETMTITPAPQIAPEPVTRSLWQRIFGG